MNTYHPVVIVGGGLGGLTAARVLHTRGLASVIFEGEADRAARVQGGMLDIHDHNGQIAVRAAELWDGFEKLIHPGGEATRVMDSQGNVLLDEHDDGGLKRPEVDRGQLRDLLIDSLPPDTIAWGRRVVDVTAVHDASREPGRWRVTFDDGDSVATDLLIGADGAWSRVRRVVTNHWPSYTGISFVEADLHHAAERHPAEAAAMGDGMLFALHSGTGILGHLETDGSLHVYVGFRVDESWIDTVDWTNDRTARATVLARLDGWDDALRGMIANADGPLTARRINALPAGITWDRVPGVTLLGDAAHVMSPFAGEGANLAMYDAALLATAVADHPGDTEAALDAYERDLFPRAASAAAESEEGLKIIFRDDAPQGLLDMFASFTEQGEEKHGQDTVVSDAARTMPYSTEQ